MMLRLVLRWCRGWWPWQVVGLVLLIFAGSAVAADRPDDPTLCGGQPIPGSYTWMVGGEITFTWNSVFISLPLRSREERIGDFCSEARAVSVGAYGPAVKEFCL